MVPKSTLGNSKEIVNLSSPTGSSVNDQSHRELTHVAYSSTEDAVLLMHALGPGTQLAKIDIKDSHCIIPVHPRERAVLAVSWEGGVYRNCQLPAFGLASTSTIFNAVAEAQLWILRRRGVRAVLHYLDNFLLLGALDLPVCTHALASTIVTCE